MEFLPNIEHEMNGSWVRQTENGVPVQHFAYLFQELYHPLAILSI
jgi:hypothetical protein